MSWKQLDMNPKTRRKTILSNERGSCQWVDHIHRQKGFSLEKRGGSEDMSSLNPKEWLFLKKTLGTVGQMLAYPGRESEIQGYSWLHKTSEANLS